MPESPPVTVTQLMQQQEANKAKERELKVKRAKVKAYQGLPPVGALELAVVPDKVLSTQGIES